MGVPDEGPAMAEPSFTRHVPDLPPGSNTRQLVLKRGGHYWNFCWDPSNESVLINFIATLASRYQSQADCPFDWFDAAVACHHIARGTLGVPPPAHDQYLGHSPQQAR